MQAEFIETGAPTSGVSTHVPRVLVLLATYNGRMWLQDQLDSILAQEEVDVHVLIGDDLSKDDTCDLIRSRWSDDRRVELIAWDSSSGSAGANFRRLYRMADVSSFNYVALADQDDIWLPDKLSSAVRELDRQGAAGYSCAVESFWPDGRSKVVSQCRRVRQADYLFEGAGQGCTFVITAALFSRLQLFCRENKQLAELMHYHDWLVYLLARVSGEKWCFDPAPHMRYRQHGGNEIGSRGKLSAVTKRLSLIRNGWYREQIIAALEIVRKLGREPDLLSRFDRTFRAPQSVSRRVRVASFMFFHGRRRLSDRVVLGLSALRGWI